MAGLTGGVGAASVPSLQTTDIGQKELLNPQTQTPQGLSDSRRSADNVAVSCVIGRSHFPNACYNVAHSPSSVRQLLRSAHTPGMGMPLQITSPNVQCPKFPLTQQEQEDGPSRMMQENKTRWFAKAARLFFPTNLRTPLCGSSARPEEKKKLPILLRP